MLSRALNEPNFLVTDLLESQKIVELEVGSFTFCLNQEISVKRSSFLATAASFLEAYFEEERVSPHLKHKVKESKEKRARVSNPEIVKWGEDVIVAEVVVVTWVRISECSHVGGPEEQKEKRQINYINKEQSELVAETLRHKHGHGQIAQPISKETNPKWEYWLLLEVEGVVVGKGNHVKEQTDHHNLS